MISTRPLSTTTRIKTFVAVSDACNQEIVRDHCPLQQGLRLIEFHISRVETLKYETIVHYNKD